LSDHPATAAAGSGCRLTKPSRVIAAFGTLTDDATIEDLDAWESETLDPPPFFEVGPYFHADAGTSLIAVLELPEPGKCVIVGLGYDNNQVHHPRRSRGDG